MLQTQNILQLPDPLYTYSTTLLCLSRNSWFSCNGNHTVLEQ